MLLRYCVPFLTVPRHRLLGIFFSIYHPFSENYARFCRLRCDNRKTNDWTFVFSMLHAQHPEPWSTPWKTIRSISCGLVTLSTGRRPMIRIWSAVVSVIRGKISEAPNPACEKAVRDTASRRPSVYRMDSHHRWNWFSEKYMCST